MKDLTTKRLTEIASKLIDLHDPESDAMAGELQALATLKRGEALLKAVGLKTDL